MLKRLLSIFLCLPILSVCHAGGNITHMFLAKEIITQVADPQLKQILTDNLDAYLVGANYPDSGYVRDTGYGEDSHWDLFIYSFADYLKEKYQNPATQNPKLLAFLFGCATHRVSDQVMHQTFYNYISSIDFNNDWSTAHTYGDIGIDFLAIIDKNQWFTQPETWWVPVRDLLQVYHRMGKDQYTAAEIIHGNQVISVIGTAERVIALPAYLYLQFKMPWTANNYYTWSHGGIKNNELQVISYQNELWQYLHGQTVQHARLPPDNSQSRSVTIASSPHTMSSKSTAIELATTAIMIGAVSAKVRENIDGSVDIQPPEITNQSDYQNLIYGWLEKIRKGL